MAPQIGVEAGYDEAFVRELDRLCGDDDFPMGTEGEREKELDHGTLVPLYLSTSITGIISWCGSADPDCPLPTITGQDATLPGRQRIWGAVYSLWPAGICPIN